MTLAGCIILIIFVHRTDCCVTFRFCSVPFFVLCTLLLTVNVYGAELLFVTHKIYTSVLFNNFFFFFLSMHNTKIRKLLVNIGSIAFSRVVAPLQRVSVPTCFSCLTS